MDSGTPQQAAVRAGDLPENPVGLFYAWWRGDPLPDLPPPAGMTLDHTPDPDLIGRISGHAHDEIESRFRQGNSALVARIDGEPAGIGWSSAGEVGIGELGMRFTMPPANRYLWDFVTLPAWRGRGIYPALLQAFIRHDAAAERFWVGHDLDNTPSARGILKAGFKTTGAVYDLPATGPIFVTRPGDLAQRAEPAARLLGIPLVVWSL